MSDKHDSDVPVLNEALSRRHKGDDERLGFEDALGELAALQDAGYGSDTIIDPPEDAAAGPADGTDTETAEAGDAGSHYEIGDELARGGMGVILNAFDTNIQRDVAMKVIGTDWGESREFIERFVREAQVQGQLEHPNICPVHELGVDRDGRVYFTMKKVQGVSLADMIKEARDSESAGDPQRLIEILNIFLKICDGLAFAHSRSFIHRDLKPDNIMVGDFGEVYVMDWGLARILGAEDVRSSGLIIAERPEESETLKTMAGSVVGTPAYMPPEQAKGQIEAMDERSDIYSLGALLYELLTLEPPFSGRTPWDILSRIEKEVPPRPSVRVGSSELSSELDTIIMKCLEKEKSDRYQSVQELKGDIELYLAGRPIAAMEYSFWGLFTKWVARNRILFASALAVLLILLLSFAVSYVRIAASQREAVLQRDRAEEQRQIAEEQRDLARVKEQEAVTARAEAEQQRSQAEEQRIEAEKNEIRSRLSLAMVLEEKRDIGEAEALYLTIKKDMQYKKFNLFPYIDLMRWRAVYNHGTPVRIMTGVRDLKTSPRCVAVNKDGTVMAVGNQNGPVLLFNTKTCRELGVIPEHASGASALGFSPLKNLLAVGDAGMDIKLWDLDSRSKYATLSDPALKNGTAHAYSINVLAFSPDGTLLASAGDEVIKLWDVGKKELKKSLWGHLRNVESLAFSPDGKRLLSGCEGRTVRLWNIEKGAEGRILYEQWDHVNAVAFHPGGKLIASTGNDTTVRLWDLENNREIATLRGHISEVNGLAFVAGGSILASCGHDSTVRFWDIERKAPVAVFRDHSGPVHSIVSGPDRSMAVTVSRSGEVLVWSTERGGLVDTAYFENYKITTLDFSPDSSVLGVGTFVPGIAPVMLLSTQTAEVEARLTSHGARVKGLAISRNGKLLASCGEDGLFRVVDLQKRELLETINARNEQSTSFLGSMIGTALEMISEQTDDINISIADLAISPDSTKIATVGKYTGIKLWDTATFERVHTFSCPGNLLAVAFSPDGRFVATGGKEQAPMVWNMETRKLEAVIDEMRSALHYIDFSPDSRLMAGGLENGMIVIWDTGTWQTIRTMTGHHGHHGRIGAVSFSPDGRLLASGSVDTTVRIWDVATGDCILTLAEHEHDVEAVVFSPDGSMLATGSRDHTVKIWRFGDALKPFELEK